MGFFSSFPKRLGKKRKTSEDQNNPAHRESNPIATPPLLSLEILSAHVRLYSASPAVITNDALAQQAMTPGNDAPPTLVTRLLSGTLADFRQYSGEEASRWLINIAHDLCDPVECRGTLVVQREQGWVRVMDTDLLIASRYQYQLRQGATICLSKISRQIGHSRTSTTGNASTMANDVMRRDGECWVTGLTHPLINSHICPKRMGDHTARIIVQTFAPGIPFANLSIYHEIFGLNLVQQLDHLFDLYQLGFHYIAPVRTFYFLISKFFTDQPFRTFTHAMYFLMLKM